MSTNAGASPYRAAIERAAIEADLEPALVEAVVLQESSGHADAFRHEPAYYERYVRNVSRWADWEPRRVASSYGLMQVMYPTALQAGWSGEPEELFRIDVNLRVGCVVLSSLVKQFANDLHTALGAYNAGPGNAGSIAAHAYADSVMAKYRRLRGNYDTPSTVNA